MKFLSCSFFSLFYTKKTFICLYSVSIILLLSHSSVFARPDSTHLALYYLLAYEEVDHSKITSDVKSNDLDYHQSYRNVFLVKNQHSEDSVSWIFEGVLEDDVEEYRELFLQDDSNVLIRTISVGGRKIEYSDSVYKDSSGYLGLF